MYFCHFKTEIKIKKLISQPKILYRYFRKKGWKRFFSEHILQANGSNKTKALSISCGLLVGVTPFYGFHTFIILFLASIFRLNKLISFLFTRISIPPLFPLIVSLALFLGSPFVQNPTERNASVFSVEFLKAHAYQYLIGTAILGLGLSLFGGLIAYFILEKTSKKNQLQASFLAKR